jgi:hypothetical protein
MLVLRCYFEIPPAMEDASSYRPDRLSSRSRPINTLNGTRGVISGVRRRSSRRHDSGIRAARVDHSRVHHCQVESESLGHYRGGRDRLGDRPLHPHALPAARLGQTLPPLGDGKPLLPREKTRRALLAGQHIRHALCDFPTLDDGPFHRGRHGAREPMAYSAGVRRWQIPRRRLGSLHRKATAEEATDLLQGKVSWQTGLTAAAGVLLISGVLFIDWRELLGRKKLRLNFAIWKQ